MPSKIIPVSDYNDFVSKTENLGHKLWIFRGHSELSWRIESSLARHLRAHQKNIMKISYDARENDSIKKFQKSAHQFLNHLPDKKDMLGWLAIMQHFGAPTRLVDFTYSPYVALFFAVTYGTPSIRFGEKLSDIELDKRYKQYEVHALHLKSLREYARKILGINYGDPSNSDYRIGDGVNQTNEFVGFFEGIRHNPRQIAQQGLFLVPSKIGLDVEDILIKCPSLSKTYPNTAWITFQFPSGRMLYRSMINSLINANLTAESLFPGLEGVARSIYQKWYQRRIALP